MQDITRWLTTMFNAGGTDMAIAITVMVVVGVLALSWLLLPFAVFGVKSRVSDLTRATNYNTAEIRALRNDTAKQAQRAARTEAQH